MKEEKIKEILADAQDFDPLTADLYKPPKELEGIDIDWIAKQILELELSLEDLCKEICGDFEKPCDFMGRCSELDLAQKITQAQALKARLYYEGKNDG